MDDFLAGSIEVGGNGDDFLAIYTPHTHRVLPPAAPSYSLWPVDRALHVSPANDPDKLALHGRVREKVRSLLDEAKDDWALVSVFGVATYTLKPQPVLVIVLRPDDRRPAARYRQIILDACRIMNSLEVVDLGIEIVQGDVAPRAGASQQYAADCQAAAALVRDTFSTQPQLGSSVKLELPNGVKETLGITCHHVFSRFRSPVVSPPIGVVSPVSYIRDIRLLDIESLLMVTSDAGRASAHPILRVAQERDCTFGDVFLTSGLCRTSKGNHSHALDWGLISVHKTRLTAGSVVWSNDPSRLAQEFLKVKTLSFQQAASGKRVYKEGATTNITCGFLANDIAEVRTRHTLPNDEKVIVHHQEQVVLGDGVPWFSTFGDSGAAVRHHDGTIVGILWGGMTRLSTKHYWPTERLVVSNLVHRPLCLSNITFVTPTRTLLKDMRAEIAKRLVGIEFTLQPLPYGRGNPSL